MFTIQDYIDSLNRDKASLVANLTTKGVSASDSETFTTLVPKVLDIITPNLQSKSETITSNTTTLIEPESGYNGLSSVSITTNVEPDMSMFFKPTISSGYAGNPGFINMIKTIPSTTTVSGTSLAYAFQKFAGESLPTIDTSSVTNMDYMCDNSLLITAPSFDTSHVTSIRNCFATNVLLENVPVYNWSSINGQYSLFYVFYNSNRLTNTSLDNILQSCISATSYTHTKTLAQLGITNYASATIEALPHYQDFLDAGWTIS